MSEEIKQILDGLNQITTENKESKNPLKCTLISFEVLYKLLDYITNLQEENERLQENNQSYQEEMARTWKIADNYKSRCEKAVEYIKENIADIEFMEKEYDIDFLKRDCIETEYDNIKILLNILGGDE